MAEVIETNVIKSLSDAIAEPLTKAYRAGGLALTFLLLGSILMLTATLIPTVWLSGALVATGFLLVLVVCGLFFFKELRPLARAQRVTAQNQEMIDNIQAVGVALSDLALELQSLAFKNSEQVEAMYSTILTRTLRTYGVSIRTDVRRILPTVGIKRSTPDSSHR